MADFECLNDEPQLFAVTRHQLAEGELFWRYAFICCESNREQSAGLAIELPLTPHAARAARTKNPPETRIYNAVKATGRDSLRDTITKNRSTTDLTRAKD